MDPDTPRWILAPLAWGGGGGHFSRSPHIPMGSRSQHQNDSVFQRFYSGSGAGGSPPGEGGGVPGPPISHPTAPMGTWGGQDRWKRGVRTRGGRSLRWGWGALAQVALGGGGGLGGCWGSHPPAGPIRPPKAPAEGPPPRDLGGGGSAGQDVGGLGHQFAIAGLDLLDDDGAGLGEGRALQGGGGHNVAGAGERGAEAPPEAPAKAGCWGRGTSRERGGTNGGGGIQVGGVPGTPPPYRSTPSSWCGCSGFACRTPACQEKFGRGGRG